MNINEEITVYRAISDDYDKSPGLPLPEQGVIYDLRRFTSTGIADPKRSATLWNRGEKIMHPPKNGLASVYLDGSLSPKVKLRIPVETWLAVADMALFKHPWRTCAYAEIDECVAKKKITADEGQKARSHMMLAGFPRDYGLWACGMLVRRVHANSLQIFAAPLWWELVQQVPRDQIWLPFVLWRLNEAKRRIHTIDADIYNNKWLTFRRHGA